MPKLLDVRFPFAEYAKVSEEGRPAPTQYETDFRRYDGSNSHESVPSDTAFPALSYANAQSLTFEASPFRSESAESLPKASYERDSEVPLPYETAERKFPEYEYAARFPGFPSVPAAETATILHEASREVEKDRPDGSVTEFSNHPRP